MSEQATTELLPEKVRAEIDRWNERFPADQKRSGLLYALRVAQEHHGWLSDDVIEAVANHLDLPKIQAFEVATFYSMYNLKPCGKHKVGICSSISCMLRGSDKLVKHVKDKYGVSFGEVSADDRFYLQEVECLAACTTAPAVIIDDKHYHENLTPEELDKVLDSLE